MSDDECAWMDKVSPFNETERLKRSTLWTCQLASHQQPQLNSRFAAVPATLKLRTKKPYRGERVDRLGEVLLPLIHGHLQRNRQVFVAVQVLP